MPQEYNPSAYQAMIDAILSAADLDKISIKRIRNAIQELFDVDLSTHKEEVNDIILKRYYKLADEREKQNADSDSDSKPVSEFSPEQVEKNDHLMAMRLQKQEKRRVTRGGTPVSSKVSKVTKSPREKTTKRMGPNNAFNADLILSPQLQDIVGSPRMSRPQVVKQMWVYIKANDLQNVDDKRKINCDEKLKALFKRNTVTMFEMNKHLSKHLYKEDEISIPKEENDSVRQETSKEKKSSSSLSRVKREPRAADSSDISDVDD